MTETQRSVVAWVAVLAAIVLLLVGTWLAFHNPELVDPNPGGVEPGWHCAAPYDVVLFGNDSVPGGGPWSDSDVMGERCRQTDRKRFAGGAGLFASAVVLLGSATALGRRR
jgi:hypothetical protein